MKKVLALLIILSGTAFAQEGKDSVECFDLGIQLPTSFTIRGVEGLALLKSNGTMCVLERNMKNVDEDGILTQGQIEITVTSGGKQVAQYFMAGKSSEGAAGSILTTYARTAKDITEQMDKGQVDEANMIHLRVRNDRFKRGEIMGSAQIFGTTVSLLKK